MSINTTLAGLSTTASTNGPDGTVDAPSTIAAAIQNALAFTATLRDTKAAIGANTDITSLGSIASINGGQLAGMRNRIINGGFDVWQRGTSFAVTTVSNTYTADRWVVTLNQVTSGTLAIVQNTAQKDVGMNYAMEVNQSSVVTTAGVNITQIIETLNVRPLQGKTITVSIRAKVLSGTAACTLTSVDGTNTDAFPTGGTTNSTAANLTTTWQTFSIPAFVLSSGTTSLALRFNTPASFTGVVYLGQAQVEIGSVPTVFEHFSYGLNLSLCQRYFEKSYAPTTPPGTATFVGALRALAASVTDFYAGNIINFRVTKRGVSNFVFFSGATGASQVFRDETTNSDIGFPNVIYPGTSGAYLYNSSASLTAGRFYNVQWQAESEL